MTSLLCLHMLIHLNLGSVSTVYWFWASLQTGPASGQCIRIQDQGSSQKALWICSLFLRLFSVLYFGDRLGKGLRRHPFYHSFSKHLLSTIARLGVCPVLCLLIRSQNLTALSRPPRLECCRFSSVHGIGDLFHIDQPCLQPNPAFTSPAPCETLSTGPSSPIVPSASSLIFV